MTDIAALHSQNMRVKFADEPAKFVESEVELDDEIKRMHAIAAVPELYPILVKVIACVQYDRSLFTHCAACASWTR